MAVRWYLFESKCAVHRLCLRHGRECVQTDASIPDGPRLIEHARDQQTPESRAPLCRLNVEAFHLTSLGVDRLEGNAPARYPVHRCQEKTTARRSVRARQSSDFFGETLEVKVDVEGSLIFAEELTHLLDLFDRLRLSISTMAAWGRRKCSLAREWSSLQSIACASP